MLFIKCPPRRLKPAPDYWAPGQAPNSLVREGIGLSSIEKRRVDASGLRASSKTVAVCYLQPTVHLKQEIPWDREFLYKALNSLREVSGLHWVKHPFLRYANEGLPLPHHTEGSLGSERNKQCPPGMWK